MIEPYYRSADGGIVIYHGDALDVLPQLEAVDHVITDPPYGEVTHAGARSIKALDEALVTFENIEVPALSRVLALCGDITSRWLVSTMEWRHVAVFEQCPPAGWEFVRHGVWVKPNGAPQFTGDRPGTGWESVAIFHRPGRKRWNDGGHHAVWTCHIEHDQEHPTQKPIALIRRFVQQFTDPGDLILDPFMGSGTTIRAAKDLGRRAIGIEISREYVDVAVKRLAQEVMPL